MFGDSLRFVGWLVWLFARIFEEEEKIIKNQCFLQIVDCLKIRRLDFCFIFRSLVGFTTVDSLRFV